MASNIPTFNIAFSVKSDSSSATYTYESEREVKKVRNSVSQEQQMVRCNLEVTFSCGTVAKFTTKPIKLESGSTFVYINTRQPKSEQAVTAFRLFLNKLNESQDQPKSRTAIERSSTSSFVRPYAEPAPKIIKESNSPTVSICNSNSPEFRKKAYDVFRCKTHELVDTIGEVDFFTYLQSYKGDVDLFEKTILDFSKNVNEQQSTCLLEFITFVMQSQLQSNCCRKQNKEVLDNKIFVFVPFPIPITANAARSLLNLNAKRPSELETKKIMQDNLDRVVTMSSVLRNQLTNNEDYDIAMAFDIAKTYCWNFNFFSFNDFKSVLDKNPDYKHVFASEKVNVTDYNNMPVVTIDDIKLYYRTVDDIDNDKPTLVFLHGGAGMADHNIYIPFWSQFSSQVNVVFIDQRGCGKSEKGDPNNWNLTQHGKDVFSLCEALDIQQPIVAGVSWGGYIAISHAIQYPDHLKALILCNTEAKVSPEERYKAFLRIANIEVANAVRAFDTDWNSTTNAEYFRLCLPFYAKKAYTSDELAVSLRQHSVTSYRISDTARSRRLAHI